MKYKLTVIKYENNENYEAEMAKWKEAKNDKYGYCRSEPIFDEPRLEVSTRSPEVFLTEEEFKKVKAETIKVFE